MKVYLCVGRAFLLFTALSVSLFCEANSGAGETFKEGVNYLAIKPPLVVNYGAGGNRVRYIKAEISMRVEDLKAAQEVSHHMPVVRDTLIMLFSSMTDEQVGSGQGKEEMRQEALKRVNEALELSEHPAANSEQSTKDPDAKKEHEVTKESSEKEQKAVAEASSSPKGNQEEHKGLVTDLLFDNLVVQR